MTDVVLFHHAQGRTDGVHELAERIRAAGHRVGVPDAYEGATFATLEEGLGYAREVGFDTVLERARAAADELPADVVYVGLSLGVMPAQLLAQTRPGARGAVLVGSCVPAAEFGGPWPTGVRLQVHGMDADPVFAGEGDLDAARELVPSVEGGELFVYPGDRHLFVDSSLGDYDEAATTLFLQRVLALLAEAGQPAD